jgi:hypothetical protein
MVRTTNPRTKVPTTIAMTAKKAVTWFLCDMAEVSGFAISGFNRTADMRSMYPVYRPMLTSPDPWYYAGTVALEASKICDLFPAEESDGALREVIDQVDGIIARNNKDVSTLTFLMLGRLGLGSVLMRRKVPDDMLGKIMMILIGSETSAAARMPSPDAHKQLRKALKFGPPMWWAEFTKDYHIEAAQRPMRRNPPIRDRAAAAAGII